MATGLDDDLASDQWTVFAPTNEAFAMLGQANIDYFYNDTAAFTDLLLYHVVAGEALQSSDLPCPAGSNLVSMANGQNSRT
jgi:uncharacterized surface protein with fasciclin (FAS1) repeats